MSPLLIAVIMLVGTAMAGVLGALLSLPIAGAFQVLLEDVLARRRARWDTSAKPAEAHAERPSHLASTQT
jgi:putative heme transporter